MAKASERKRVTFRVDDDQYQQLLYWSSSRDMSVDEFVRYCVDHTIAFYNGEIETDTLVVQRMNQLIDMMAMISSNQKALESIMTHSFASLIGLTRGDNYLMEAESGEL